MAWLWKSRTRRELERFLQESENLRKRILVLQDNLLEHFAFKEVRENLKKYDSSSDIEEKRKYWHAARQKLLELKNFGFENEVRAFLKKEGRTIKLIQD